MSFHFISTLDFFGENGTIITAKFLIISLEFFKNI